MGTTRRNVQSTAAHAGSTRLVAASLRAFPRAQSPTGVAEADAAAADQDAERQLEMPGLVRQGGEQQPGPHQCHP